MKMNIEIELDDLVDTYGASIDQEICEHLKSEVMKKVKRDPKYKAWVEKKTFDVITSLEV